MRNAAETLVWTTEKMIADNKEKISETDVKELEEKMADVKSAVQAGEKEKMKTSTESLGKIAQKVGASLYEAQKNAPAGAQHAQEVAPETEATHAEEPKSE